MRSKIKDINKTFNINPTQVVVLGFAITILIGSILLSLPVASKSGQSAGYINALFTSTSAVCVTGLVIADTYSNWTVFGQLVILALIQIGGLGFMTMATLFSLALRRRINLKERLIIVESLNQYNLQGIVKLTKRILITTFAFEGIGAVILSLRFIPEFGIKNGIYKGIFHAISAFCNAGFDLMGQKAQFSSLTSYVSDPVVSITVTLLIIFGGIGFAVMNDIYTTRNIKGLTLHSKLVLAITGALLLFGFIFFFIMEYNNPATMGPLDFKSKLLASWFQSVTPRTAGFNTVDTAGLKDVSVFVTMILMFLGASPGSTGGGIKTTTIAIIIFTVVSIVKNRKDTEMFKRRLDESTVSRALAVAFLSAAVVSITTTILLISENAPFIEAMFEAISAFGTVGLSMGITPSLSVVGKIAIIITMFLGRVGVLSLVIALSARAQKGSANYRYPEEKVMVG